MANDENDIEEQASQTAGRTGAATEADDDELPQQIRQQRDEYYDRLLRKTAEFDNYRKRTDRERLQLSEAAAADLLKELLPLVDDMERALRAEGNDVDAIRRGIELILKQLLETLRKRGVRPIDALGADFDPHYHMAVAHEPANDRRDGEVVEEFTRGYMLGDRLLRPAMVKVAKG